MFSLNGAVEEISCIKLHGGLVGEDFHLSATWRMNHAGGTFHACCLAQHPAVVVTAGEGEGFEGCVDAVAHDVGLGEVERSALDRGSFTCGDQPGIGGEEMIGLDVHDVIEDALTEIAREIPVGVVDHVDDGRRIGSRLRFPQELVLLIECVGYSDIERAGIAFLAIDGAIAEDDGIFFDFTLPKDFVKTLDAAVEVAGDATRLIVFGESVSFAFELKLSVFDAIAKTADGGAEIGVIRQPAGERIVAERDIGDFSVAIGCFERYQNGTVFRNLGDGSLGVAEGEKARLAAIGKCSVQFRCDHGSV